MPTEGEHLQLLTITFTPDTDSCLPDHDTQPFVVTFKAQWGEKITTGVFRFPLSPAQIRVLLPLLQEYVDPARCKKLAQAESAQAALRALGIEPTTESVSVEQLPTLMGIALFEALFHRDSHVKKLWDTFHDSATQHTTVEHRIVLHFIDRQDCKASIPLLIALPWELLASKEKEDPFLVAQDSTFTLVRTYQPAELFQKPSPDHQPTEERPSILLLETEDDTLKSLAKMVRPRELNKNNSLWCRMQTYQWKDSTHQPRTFKPQIIHVVAHGMRHQNRNWIVYRSEDDKNGNVIGPYKLASALQDAGSTTVLIVSFVCHSGVTNENKSPDSNSSQSGRSLLGELTNVAPALLLMQGLILDDDAMTGSEALYETIANREGIALAVRKMRREIYPESRDIRHETSWWIPTLYLRNPQAEYRLVKQTQDDPARKALILPSDVLEVLDAVPDSPTLITLQCEPEGGKKFCLHRIADYLRSEGYKYILLPPIPNDKADNGWFEEATSEIVNYICACIPMLRECHDITYKDAVCKFIDQHFNPVFVLCDDGDRLMDEHWRRLFPASIQARLIFITTTSDLFISDIPYIKQSNLKWLFNNDELRALQRPALEKFRENRPDTIDYKSFCGLEIIFFTAQIALSRDTLVGIFGSDEPEIIVDNFLNHAISHKIASDSKGRYKAEILTPSDIQIANKFFFKAIKDYITNLFDSPKYDNSWPEDLLDIIVHQDYYKDINPVSYKDENNVPWRRWRSLAIKLSERGQSEFFVRIALHQAEQTPYTIVREGLYYLVLLVGKLIPPKLYDAKLWHTLWPELGKRITPMFILDCGGEDTTSNNTLDISDARLTQLIENLENDANPYLSKHQELLTVLRGRYNDTQWLQKAYDAHRQAIANSIATSYDTDDIKTKSESVHQELIKASEHNDRIEFWGLILNEQRRNDWFEILVSSLRKYIFSIKE
nr:hypothetical protein [Oscillochloris trichoides]